MYINSQVADFMT